MTVPQTVVLFEGPDLEARVVAALQAFPGSDFVVLRRSTRVPQLSGDPPVRVLGVNDYTPAPSDKVLVIFEPTSPKDGLRKLMDWSRKGAFSIEAFVVTSSGGFESLAHIEAL